MRIDAIKCPNCGADFYLKDNGKIQYCNYCGAHLFFDDGVFHLENKYTINSKIIVRDEARLKEAENTASRIKLEDRALRRKEKQIRKEARRRATRNNWNYPFGYGRIDGETIILISGIVFGILLCSYLLIWLFQNGLGFFIQSVSYGIAHSMILISPAFLIGLIILLSMD